MPTDEELSQDSSGAIALGPEIDFTQEGESGVGSVVLTEELVGVDPADELIEPSASGDLAIATDVDFFEDGESGVGSITLVEDVISPGEEEETLTLNAVGSVEISEDVTGFPEKTIPVSGEGNTELSLDIDFTQDGVLGIGSVLISEDVESSVEPINETIEVDGRGSIDGALNILANQPAIESLGLTEIVENLEVQKEIENLTSGSVALIEEVDTWIDELLNPDGSALVDLLDALEAEEELSESGIGSIILIENVESPGQLEETISLNTAGSVLLSEEVVEGQVPGDPEQEYNTHGVSLVELLTNVELARDLLNSGAGSVEISVEVLTILPPVRFENLDFHLNSHYLIPMILTPESP